jgi:hypothetical protein
MWTRIRATWKDPKTLEAAGLLAPGQRQLAAAWSGITIIIAAAYGAQLGASRRAARRLLGFAGGCKRT